MQRGCGFTLIEVLVTIMILAVGLLGLAAMQLVGLKNINHSHYQTLATLYAYDMAERIRSNAGIEALEQYAKQPGDDEKKPDCSTACAPADIARRDILEWNQLITAGAVELATEHGGLPAGAVGSVQNKGAGIVDIKITWVERQRLADSAKSVKREFVLTVRI